MPGNASLSVPGNASFSERAGRSSLEAVLGDICEHATVIEADPGRYDRCHENGKGIFWVYLSGQIRSFGMHPTNFRTFLDQSHTCRFLVIYTRSDITGRYDPTRPWSASTDAALDRLKRSGVTPQTIIKDTLPKLHPGASNLAFAVMNYSKRAGDSLRGVTLLGRETARVHGIPQAPLDIVAWTRPDIMFTHAINVPGIAAVMTKVPHVLLPHHDRQVGNNDPSEMLVIAPRLLFEGLCPLNKSDPYPPNMIQDEWLLGCLSVRSSCGYFAGPFVFAAKVFNMTPFFYHQPISLFLHRINGEFNVSVMRGMDRPLPMADSPVRPALDLWRNVQCVVPDVSSCTAGGQPPASRCWGGTKRVGINPSGGLWLCTNFADVDVTCAEP